MSTDEFDVSEWGDTAKLITDAETEGHMVSIGSDDKQWIVNWVEDPDRTTTWN